MNKTPSHVARRADGCDVHRGLRGARSAAARSRRWSAGPWRTSRPDVVLHHQRRQGRRREPRRARWGGCALPVAGRGGRTEATRRGCAYLSTQGAGAVNARDRIGSRSMGQSTRTAHRAECRRASRRHDRAGAHGQRAGQAAFAERERAASSTASATSPTNTTSSPVRLPTAAPTPTPPITPAATTPATPPRDPRSSVTRTSRVAATGRGTRRTPRRAAARRTWSPRAAPGCCIASPRIDVGLRPTHGRAPPRVACAGFRRAVNESGKSTVDSSQLTVCQLSTVNRRPGQTEFATQSRKPFHRRPSVTCACARVIAPLPSEPACRKSACVRSRMLSASSR